MQVACGKYLVNDYFDIPKKTILEKSSFPDIRLQTQESYYWQLIHFKEHNLTLVLYSAFFTKLEVLKCLQHLITIIARSFFSIGTSFCRLWTSSKINQKNLLNVTLGYRLLKNCECGQIVSIISILHVCSSMRVQNESFSSLTPRPNL